MGQSTDAILVWGFDLGDPSERDDDGKLSDRIEKLNEEEYQMLSAAEKEHGVELVRHCSGDCPMYIVGVISTLTRAWRGHPQEIATLEHPVAEDQARLDGFAKFLGVDPQSGRWVLASDWS